MSDPLLLRIESWKDSLLDTSKRNRLLYFKSDAALSLLEPEIGELWKRLISRGKPQTFHGWEKDDVVEEVSDDESSTRLAEEAPLKPLKSDEIRASLRGTKLSRFLYGLRSKSNLSLEEQGVTTLFVAWGLLQWREAGSRENDPKSWVQSPLLLTPMQLLRESSRAPYRLRLLEEEAWLNPVLTWKLANDWKIALPQPPAFDDVVLAEYLQSVREIVREQSGWSVNDSAHLGLFSFHKMAMYNDLRDNADLAAQNPFVRALGGDGTQLPPLPENVMSGAQLDTLPPQQSFCVLDCDSSQQEAVQAAREGASLVLQGPPGTGKSQTITNIIAECLAGGKRVLFVSEKMAALDVVYERLRQSGLDAFCLKAHSQSANKKEVIADLARTLAMARTASQSQSLADAKRRDETDSEELSRLREDLNSYVRALHERQGAMNRTAFEAAGEIAAQHRAPELFCALPDPMQLDSAGHEARHRVLENAVLLQEVWHQGAAHSWHGARETEFSLDLLAAIRAHAADGQNAIQTLENSSLSLMQICGVEGAISPQLAAALPALARLLAASPQPPKSWINGEESLESLATDARTFKARYEALATRRANINARYDATFWNLPHGALCEIVTTKHAPTLERGGSWESFPTWSDELLRRLERAAKALLDTSQTSVKLAALLGIAPPQSLAQAGQFANALNVLEREIVAPDVRPLAAWFSDFAGLTAKVKDAIAIVGQREQEAQKLVNYRLEVLRDIDCVAMSSRFHIEYSNPLRFLKSGFRHDLKVLNDARNDGTTLDYDVARRDLEHAAQWQKSRAQMEAQASENATLFGAWYQGETTDWTRVAKSLEACVLVESAFAVCGGVSARMREILARGVAKNDFDADNSFETLNAHLREMLLTLRDDWQWLPSLFSLRDLPFQENGATLAAPQAPLDGLATWLQNHADALRDMTTAFEQVAACRTAREATYLPAQIVADCREAQAIVRDEDQLSREIAPFAARCGAFFQGAKTAWSELFSALNWTHLALKWWRNAQATENGLPTPLFIERATQSSTRLELETSAQEVQDQSGRLENSLKFFDDLFEQPISRTQTLHDCRAWFQSRAESATQFEPYSRWLRVRRALDDAGLSDFWEASRRANLKSSQLWPTLEKRFWGLWLDAAARQAPVLAHFAGARHDADIERFGRLDLSSQSGAQRRVQERLWENKPVASGISSTRNARGEIAILQKEAVKKARHKPLRRLFREIPHLLSALKPCVLMSPLSVAQFLDAARADFDVVIFDEASQICPEDGIGAIMRARQMIVVGDRKQLPPTRFFASGAVFDEEETDETLDDGIYESILDSCAPHLPNFMLLWHYRSRDESLISFSNQNFYDGRLITFPGPQRGGIEGRGVRLESVEGTYFRGKSPNARTNPIEAQRVAELVIRHAEAAPRSSLGVIALNAQQANAIMEAIDAMLYERPDLDEFFMRRDERFFVKALENVQGDERDAIILSVGFGPDESGKISMNFGPLNRDGGERRLNVAVTRARDSLTVVSSMQPGDIDASRTTMRGPQLLRAYLEMAQRGGSSGETEHDQARDRMIASIAQALEERGLTVARRIGRSTLRIDLAIEDPQQVGSYALGIECDGHDYAAAPTARDRDRLRPAVLRALGWKLLHVWSLDWLRDPQAQIERIMAALEEDNAADEVSVVAPSYEIAAREVSDELAPSIEYSIPEPVLLCEGAFAIRRGATFQEMAPFVSEFQSEIDALQNAATSQAATLEAVQMRAAKIEENLGAFDIEERDASRNIISFGELLSLSAPVSVVVAPPKNEVLEEIAEETAEEATSIYEPTVLPRMGSAEDFYFLAQSESPQLLEALAEIAATEGPVSLQVAARRLAGAFGIARAGAQVLRQVRGLCEKAQAGERLQLRVDENGGEWLWPFGLVTPRVRTCQDGETPRNISEIAPEELQQAVLFALQQAFGLEHGDLLIQSGRALGFRSTGAAVRASLESAIQTLLRDGKITENNGALALSSTQRAL